MKHIFLLLILLGIYLAPFLVRGVIAQDGSPSATPGVAPENPAVVFETPIPAPATPEPLPPTFFGNNEPPQVPEIPDVVIIPLPTATPMQTPRPTLPVYFEIYTTPSPSPYPSIFPYIQTGDTGFRNRLDVPTLSIVTQTNADEYYKNQALPKHTADLLSFIAVFLTVAGVIFYFEEIFISSIKKIRERKEYVHYINR